MSDTITLRLSTADFNDIVAALYAAGEDAAYQAGEDQKWDEEAADDMQAAADRYTALANTLPTKVVQS